MVTSQNGNQGLSAISRRRFIQSGAVFIGVAAAGAPDLDRLLANGEDSITIGMFADAHYADKETRINRYYRESLGKAKQCIKEFNSVQPDFAIQLGDFVDKGESVATEIAYLDRIEREYAKFKGERHYVLGNHDLATLSKEQFIANCGAKRNHYSFDKGEFHFVVLDACYNEDESHYNAGNFHWTKAYVPSAEQKWLEADLRATGKKTVVFVHQRLDDDGGSHGIGNAAEVRKILEQSGKVLAVFQGHDHRGAYNSISDIHYYTLPAMVEGSGLENNVYAVVRIRTDGLIEITGLDRCME